MATDIHAQRLTVWCNMAITLEKKFNAQFYIRLELQDYSSLGISYADVRQYIVNCHTKTNC